MVSVLKKLPSFELEEKIIRKGKDKRETKETEIEVYLDLDGEGKSEVEMCVESDPLKLVQNTSHFWQQIFRWSKIDARIKAKSARIKAKSARIEEKSKLDDLEHHLIEDTAIAIGEVFDKALGNKKGIKRQGAHISPFGGGLGMVALDIAGKTRSNYVLITNIENQDWREMIKHTYESFTNAAGIDFIGYSGVAPRSMKQLDKLLEMFGQYKSRFLKEQGIKKNIYFKWKNYADKHHEAEALAKATGIALGEAISIDPRSKYLIPSTKGVIQ